MGKTGINDKMRSYVFGKGKVKKILEKIAEKERVVKDIPNSILQAKQMSDLYKFPVRDSSFVSFRDLGNP